MTPRSIRIWKEAHKWTSLVCTLFLFMLCLTGLPLIFHDEIDAALGATVEPDAVAAGTPLLSFDRVLDIARAARPNDVITIVGADDENPIWNVFMASTVTTPKADAIVSVDGHTGRVLHVGAAVRGAVTKFLLDLHTDLFLDQTGMLFLGAIGLLFLVAVVSGVVVYGPFMRRLDFGTMRSRRRLYWLDVHNLFGIVILAWTLVVGITGVINTLSQQIAMHWQRTELVAMLGPWRNAPVPPKLASAQLAIDTALAHAPGMKVQSVAMPGSPFAGGHHYGVYLRGNEPLTSRLLKPVLINADDGSFGETRDMPLYVKALFVSKPLHFGDYGGMPLKIIWALLDLVTLIVLGSGLYLWAARLRKAPARSTAAAASQLAGAEASR
jgi:uncharacterized iron-regulated membrane protein